MGEESAWSDLEGRLANVVRETPNPSDRAIAAISVMILREMRDSGREPPDMMDLVWLTADFCLQEAKGEQGRADQLEAKVEDISSTAGMLRDDLRCVNARVSRAIRDGMAYRRSVVPRVDNCGAWTPVAEMLPDVRGDEYVFVFVACDDVPGAIPQLPFSYPATYNQHLGFTFIDSGDRLDRVTHWMHMVIPPHPAEAQEVVDG